MLKSAIIFCSMLIGLHGSQKFIKQYDEISSACDPDEPLILAAGCCDGRCMTIIPEGKHCWVCNVRLVLLRVHYINNTFACPLGIWQSALNAWSPSE